MHHALFSALLMLARHALLTFGIHLSVVHWVAG